MPETINTLNSKVDWATSSIAIQSTRGVSLSLHRVGAPQIDSTIGNAPVILAHGTFSNHRTCGGLARYLAGKGHDCWLLDYEGHGGSDKTNPSPNFESLFLSGTASAINHVVQHTGTQPHWIGHSGGGLAALMTLAREPDYTNQLRSLTMLGSQACDAGQRFSNRVLLRLSLAITKLIGIVPGKKLRLGPENETASVMLQWFHWNLRAQWLGEDGFDYLQALKLHPQLPSLRVLSLAGSGDWFIAPPAACGQLHARLPGTDNRWLECGTAHGFSENYSHARLISSRAAAHEIWPRVADWLAEVEIDAA